MCWFRQGSQAPGASLGFGKQKRTQGIEEDEARLVHPVSGCLWFGRDSHIQAVPLLMQETGSGREL